MTSFVPCRVFVVLLFLVTPAMLDAQVAEGELRVAVIGPDGLPAPATVILTSRSPEFRAMEEAAGDGRVSLQRLPLGLYRLSVERPGFERFEQNVEIRSGVPVELEARLRLAALATEIDVRDDAPLLDPGQPAVVMHAGREELDRALGTTLGRSTVDVITTMPGWLLEANAVLHPRGSEYDTQYVIDGMPFYDNRSLGFSPAFENVEFEAVNVMTAGIPAEFGRRLGGVIALDTRRVSSSGASTEVRAQTGSFANHAGSVTQHYRRGPTALSFGLHGGLTDRYLDPPSLENFTNEASSGGFNVRMDRELSSSDRLSAYFRSNRTNFLVPNDSIQQAVGQRQDRRSSETEVQAHYQHAVSSTVLAAARGMFRDLTARLWSNPQSTPVYVEQDRGFREGSVAGTVTVQAERHTLKFGGDVRINSLRERFLLAEPDELPEFDITFDGHERSHEASLFVQNQFRVGDFSANLGLRFDRYDLLTEDHAFSPRAAMAYYAPWADLQVRASYDRIFQPPPTENLLLSSAAVDLDIDDVEDAVPVPASRAHFFEVGLRKPFLKAFRIDVSHYWRTFRNSIDDDVFLNSGLSFPITFDTARIQGTEVRLDMPRWKWFSSTISYSNMLGRAGSPVTGGLFIEDSEADELRDVVLHFPISQDQRNTLATQFRVEPNRRVWFSAGTRYGSGLPVEIEDDDDEDSDGDSEPAIPPAIFERVNFDRGRVHPNFSLDLSAGFRVLDRSEQSLTVQFDVRNVTDRLNVINFTGLFSGTALAPRRQWTLQTRLHF